MTEKVVYNDPTSIDKSKRYTLQDLANFVRHKQYGVDVREAIALAIELIGSNEKDSENGNGNVDDGSL